MDEAVRQALARWPNVPSCTGWLRCRGGVNGSCPRAPIRHASLRLHQSSTGRRAAGSSRTARSRFSSSLDYPDDPAPGAGDHSRPAPGSPCRKASGAWLDGSSLLLGSEHGIGLLDDRRPGRVLAIWTATRIGPTPRSLEWAGLERFCRSAHPRRPDGVTARFGFIKPA